MTPEPNVPKPAEKAGEAPSLNFIRAIIEEDLKSGKSGGQVVTRFPPEPNGYLHIGHAKSICLNFGLARDYKGRCHLRFDDTNPEKEEMEYIESIMRDVRWLGFDWNEHLYYASDYFEQLFEWAQALIKKGLAYVDDQTAEQISANRGTLTEPGKESPFRNRSAQENLELFERMRKGEFPDGSKVLRAKIDMASANVNFRDPVMYRIRREEHPRTGNKWCIYPIYDWAHGQSDAIEKITHSICTLEFENHRPLYDWYIENVGIPHHPQQIEFARLNLTYTVMSKRKLLQLVQDKDVKGWDDPRMPTLAGIRRRGFTPESIRAFAERIGVSKRESTVDVTLLENAIRDDLNPKAPRVMCVLKPLKVVIENLPEGQEELLDCPYHQEKPELGTRKVPFTREIYVERDDFMEDPPKKFFRLGPGREVRLRWGYFLKCERVIKDEKGEVVELRCSYDPTTKGGNAPDGRKVKGTIHWVSAKHALPVEVRLYDRLFNVENPASAKVRDWKADLNPKSLEILQGAMAEPSLANADPEMRVQFERTGSFRADPIDSKPGAPVFNRIVSLRDTWAKMKDRED
ncbi:MAG: glutamine--tRNA ligase/YqeY domain fusion protein [Deltaproteobacteria bacterium]|nr:glutamine--tRNA ligase/YqeY domain fusion protein [Deltaproteobacteria bacterium]